MSHAMPLWQPTANQIARANITDFQHYLLSHNVVTKTFTQYRDLHHWSIEHPDDFWQSLFSYFNIIYKGRLEPACLPGEHMFTSRWFPNIELNFAENLLRRDDDAPALIGLLENGRRQEITYQQLRRHTAHLQKRLLAIGVTKGDRVAALMPNTIETVIAMLATTSLGAIWSSCSPDFGINGVIDRFGQIEPVVLFSCDGYFYNGKTIHCGEKVAAITKQLSSLKQVFITPLLGDFDYFTHAALQVPLQTFEYLPINSPIDKPIFIPVPFNHPLYIMYSSGTTGLPKCIVHGAGGTLLQHLKELSLHTDLRAEDCIFYYSTCGWMMWNWLVSSLALGAKVVLYDGSPFYPRPEILIDLIDQEHISVFGCSAKYIGALEKAQIMPKQTHSLTGLRTILSTGSPLNPGGFDYVYRDIKSDVCLSSISGGTDIISCFVLGNPTLPVYSGEIQCPGLGMNVKIFNQDGIAVTQEKGELVCTQAFPSMPIYFWNDAENKRYAKSYFERFPKVWTQGDYGLESVQGGFVIYGRSDTVLNPGGVRLGTAEIYREVEKLDEVLDSVVVGQSWQDDIRIVLFVKLRAPGTLDTQLVQRIKNLIRNQLSPRHVPAKILEVSDIPKTRSGKTVELAVAHVIHGRAVDNLDALANSEVLEQFKNRKELTEEG